MSVEVEEMDFKQLRKEVRRLKDELAVMKRSYEDILYNLDTDNFSSRIVKQGENMETAIVQNEEKILLQAEKTAENAGKIASLQVTADEISGKVSVNITAYFESEAMPTAKNTTEIQQQMLCLYDGNYYYYNKLLGRWQKYDKESGVSTFFSQTADGFELVGDVKVSGDIISGGTISGVDIVGVKYWDSGKNGYLYLRPLTETCDFEVCKADETPIFTVYDDGTGIGLKCYDYAFLRASVLNGGTTHPQGTWNFSGCTVKGLSQVAVFA